MDLSVSTWMMLFFILFMIIGMWKIYAFLPNKELEDDDTTKESQEELLKLILKVIVENQGTISSQELLEKVKGDTHFDAEHFWRFNQNRLNQLLEGYFLQNPHTKSIEDIYKNLRASKL